MNEAHMKLCSSAEWAGFMQTQLLPWAVDPLDLGDELLEVGPGPGSTTEWLRTRVARLTAVENNGLLAARLAERYPESNVDVLHGDATALPFADGTFSGAAAFTMLHHVPSAELQDRLLAEVARVLRPGGVLVGSDSLDSPAFRDLHVDDICVPVDPLSFGDRLEAAGFEVAEVTLRSGGMKFVAWAHG